MRAGNFIRHGTGDKSTGRDDVEDQNQFGKAKGEEKKMPIPKGKGSKLSAAAKAKALAALAKKK